MKHVLLFSALTIAILPVNSRPGFDQNSNISTAKTFFINNKDGLALTSQEPGNEKMLLLYSGHRNFAVQN